MTNEANNKQKHDITSFDLHKEKNIQRSSTTHGKFNMVGKDWIRPPHDI